MTKINNNLFPSGDEIISFHRKYHDDLENFVKSQNKNSSLLRDYHKNLPHAKPARKKERLVKPDLPRVARHKKKIVLIKADIPHIC